MGIEVGSDDDEEFEMVPVTNQNNKNCNVVSDSVSKSNKGENLFDDDVNEEMEANPKTTDNAKVV